MLRWRLPRTGRAHLCGVMDPPPSVCLFPLVTWKYEGKGEKTGETEREFQAHTSLALKSLSILRGTEAENNPTRPPEADIH